MIEQISAYIVTISPYIVAVGVWIGATYIFIKAMMVAKEKTNIYLTKHKALLDFGLAPESEVLEKFGDEIGKIILDERRIVFYRFGWLWAIVGAVIITIIYIYTPGVFVDLNNYIVNLELK